MNRPLPSTGGGGVLQRWSRVDALGAWEGWFGLGAEDAVFVQAAGCCASAGRVAFRIVRGLWPPMRASHEMRR
jgi:hypothetical protein